MTDRRQRNGIEGEDELAELSGLLDAMTGDLAVVLTGAARLTMAALAYILTGRNLYEDD